MVKIIISLFFSGLLFGSGPCLASCGPILISYIVGTKKHSLKALGVYGLFSLARITVYLLLVIVIYFFGRFTLQRLLGDFSKFIFIIGGSCIVLVGVFTALARSSKIKPQGPILLGLIMGILPCAPLLAILSYIGLISKSWLNSLLYSFAFGLGTFISPLILLTWLSGLIPRFLLDKKALYSRIFSFLCGVIIIILGIQLITRAF